MSEPPLVIGQYRSPTGTFQVLGHMVEGIVCVKLVGAPELDEDAQQVVALAREGARRRGGPGPVCLDLSAGANAPANVRQILARGFLGPDSPATRIGAFTGVFILRALVNLYARASRIPVRLFATEHEALAWLRPSAAAGGEP